MLLLPGRVIEDLQREQIIEHHLDIGREFTRMLQQMDPHLSCVLARENPSDPRLVPGCWHFKRANPETEPSYFPITTDDGGYREPTLRDVERMAERDLWRTPHAVDEFLAKRRASQDCRKKDAELRREQQRDEIAETYRAAKRVAGDNIDRRRWGAGRKKR